MKTPRYAVLGALLCAAAVVAADFGALSADDASQV
jgi:hypothetical protein